MEKKITIRTQDVFFTFIVIDLSFLFTPVGMTSIGMLTNECEEDGLCSAITVLWKIYRLTEGIQILTSVLFKTEKNVPDVRKCCASVILASFLTKVKRN